MRVWIFCIKPPIVLRGENIQITKTNQNQCDTKATDTITKTGFSQNDINILIHVLAKIKSMLKESQK
jgi:hypothetical protein